MQMKKNLYSKNITLENVDDKNLYYKKHCT